MNRQERRKIARTEKKDQESKLKRMRKPIQRIEFFAAMQELQFRDDVIAEFLIEKYGEEFEAFVKSKYPDESDDEATSDAVE